MIQEVPIRAYKMKPLSEEVRQKLQMSLEEAANLQEREIRCKYCNYYLFGGFNDLSGHVQIKCPRCKQIIILNMGYFCRRKHRRRIYSR